MQGGGRVRVGVEGGPSAVVVVVNCVVAVAGTAACGPVAAASVVAVVAVAFASVAAVVVVAFVVVSAVAVAVVVAGVVSVAIENWCFVACSA
jgi:hypothetical protein